MKLNKFLIIILTVTVLAFLYVYQQVKIVQMAYQAQEKSVSLRNLVDENKQLRYSLSRQTSLVSIAGIWQDGDYEWPLREQLVSLSVVPKADLNDKQMQESDNIFANVFKLKSQAEANPVVKR